MQITDPVVLTGYEPRSGKQAENSTGLQVTLMKSFPVALADRCSFIKY